MKCPFFADTRYTIHDTRRWTWIFWTFATQKPLRGNYRGAPLRWATYKLRSNRVFRAETHESGLLSKILGGSPKWGTSVVRFHSAGSANFWKYFVQKNLKIFKIKNFQNQEFSKFQVREKSLHTPRGPESWCRKYQSSDMERSEQVFILAGVEGV